MTRGFDLEAEPHLAATGLGQRTQELADLATSTACSRQSIGREGSVARTATYWSKIGVAFTNRDSSITVQLDALPVSGRLQIRADEERPERNGR